MSSAVYYDPGQRATEAAASGAYAGWSIPARVFSEEWIFIIGVKEKNVGLCG